MAKAGKSRERSTVFATNRKAPRDYTILETYEAGVQLTGTEIKSIRQHRVSLDNSFARIEDDELFLYNMHVGPYAQGGPCNADPIRTRKLLMHRREILRLAGLLSQKRVTLVPLRLYEQRGRAKIELAVGRGKQLFEKRERIREREIERELRRAVRARQK